MSYLESKGAREFQEGDVIFREKDPGSSMYIIQTGEVEVSAIKNKQKVVYAKLGKGAIFGEMALIDGNTRSATVTAVRHTTCIEMSRMLFQKQLESLPKWMSSFFQIMAERLREANKHAETLTTQDSSRLVILMVSNMLTSIEPNSQDEIITPWKPLVKDISLLLNLPYDRVDQVLNKITLSGMAKSEMNFEHGRILIMQDFSQFKYFAEYCKSKFNEKLGNEIKDDFKRVSEKEAELISFLHSLMREQRWDPAIEEHYFDERFEEEFHKPKQEYRHELKSLHDRDVIVSKLDQEDVKTYIINVDKLKTMISMEETLGNFENMDKKIG